MPYLGNEPAVAYTSTTKDSFNGDGSTTDFTMSKSANVNAVRVVVENVVQNPTVAYTCSGTTISFTSAPPTGTSNIYVVHLGPPAATIAPPTTINNATTFSDALTVSGAFTSQGIDDNANATAITIDSSENISIGDASKGGSLGQVRIINDASSSPASLALFGHNNVSDGTDFAKIQLAMQTGGVGGNVVAQITGEAEGTAENAAHLTFETATGGTLSEAMRITNDAKVGIGTAAPLRQLHIHDTSANSEIAFTAATNGVSSILFGDGQTGTDVYKGYIQYNHASDALLLASSAATAAVINSGQVFEKYGNSASARIVPQSDDAGYLGEAAHRWQAVYATNGSIQTSDKNLKTEITNSALGLDFVKALRPVSYKWISGGKHFEYDEEDVRKENPTITDVAGKRNHYGLIAQEVKEVLGDTDFGGWVSEDVTDENATQSLRYDQFIAPLVKAVQELNAEVETLKTKVAALEAG